MEGDLRSATDMLRDAITSQYFRLDLGAAIYYTAMVGNGFVSAGRPETGLQYCNAALRVASVTRGAGFPFLAYQGKARALIALNRKDEAIELLEKAIARAREDRDDFALTQLLIVAGTAVASDDVTKAIEDLEEAVELSQAKGFHHVFAWSTFELAGVYRGAGNLDAAESLATRSNRIMRELEDRYHLPQHLTLLADLKARKGAYQRADELYSEATDVIEGLLVKVNQRQLKSSLIETLSDAYVGHFELAATVFSDPEKAYGIVERARGRVLADTLRGERETFSSAGSETAKAQSEINQIQKALLHETDQDEREQLLDKLFRVEQLLSPVRRTDSALSSTGDRSKPVPLSSVETSLHSDEMLLEYVLGKTQSYCLRITKSGTAIATLKAGREQIGDLVDEYLADVRSRKAQIPSERSLFSLLLQPVIERDSKSRLIVVPDGKLNLLPSDALRDEQGRYVLESHVVTYAPSATVLYLLRTFQPTDRPMRGLLAVGDVVYSGATPAQAPVETTPTNDLDAAFVNLGELPNLPGSKEEVVSVADIVRDGSEMLLEQQATESAFKTAPLRNFRMIHLAVHGIADKQFPDRAALVLGTSPTSREDGLLQVREIRDLSLRADLVTLSACDTRNGRLLGQEGIASLERAFLLAGAKSVLASLWTADDIFTTALMKRLYQHLVDGQDKATALRKAKLELLKKYGDSALPIYWAGFVLVGEASSELRRSRFARSG